MAMIGLAFCLSFHLRSPYFKVAHQIFLGENLLAANDVRRDGSVVGSYGYWGAHDGWEHPFIAQSGEVFRFDNVKDFFNFQVIKKLKNDFFEMTSPSNQVVKARIQGNKLVNFGPMKPVSPEANGLLPTITQSNKWLNSIVPPPRGMEDTVGIERVLWYPWLNNYKLLEAQISWQMEYGHRSFLYDPQGHFVALEDAIPGLSHYEVRSIDFVSKRGWFVIDAIGKEQRGQGLTLGKGNAIFWIEPVGTANKND